MPQKLLLALLVASRKLCHYFQGHPIKVVSAYPLERVLRRPNAAGRVTEWNIELQAFQLEFSTTRVIKGAALADFVAEWADVPSPEAGEDRPLSPGSEAPDGWVMYFDGAFSHQGAGAGAVLISPTQDKLYYAVQLCFQHGEKVSNNIAEYEDLITGLKAAAALGVRRLTIRGDSQLLVNFSNKAYKPKDEHMEAYLEEVCKIEKRFLGLELQHVPRGTNKEADDIAKRASRRLPQEPGVFEERLFRPSAVPPAVGPASPQEGCWFEEFKTYLLRGVLPEKEEDAERVAH
jgi:ribonuclease HI